MTTHTIELIFTGLLAFVPVNVDCNGTQSPNSYAAALALDAPEHNLTLETGGNIYTLPRGSFQLTVDDFPIGDRELSLDQTFCDHVAPVSILPGYGSVHETHLNGPITPQSAIKARFLLPTGQLYSNLSCNISYRFRKNDGSTIHQDNEPVTRQLWEQVILRLQVTTDDEDPVIEFAGVRLAETDGIYRASVENELSAEAWNCDTTTLQHFKKYYALDQQSSDAARPYASSCHTFCSECQNDLEDCEPCPTCPPSGGVIRCPMARFESVFNQAP